MSLLVSNILRLWIFLVPPLCGDARLCYCVDAGVPALLDAADGVFIGQVLTVRDTVILGRPFHAPSRDSMTVAVATLQVRRGWKDPGSRLVAAIDLYAHTGCAADFAVGQETLVWVKRQGNGFVLLGCNTRNVRLALARDALRELGPVRFSHSE